MKLQSARKLWETGWKLNDIELRISQKEARVKWRQERDSNPRGETPVVFETTALPD